jgi:two-component system, NtrC family, sensor histidine kinase HydH
MTTRRTILCVDDNAALADNLAEILEDAGYAVRLAATCRAAIASAAERFDIALVDVRLPDGEGTDLAVRLRQLAPDAQVIMMTGYATVETAVAAVHAGAWAFLMKPCETPALLVAVEQAVRQVRHLEEKRELARRAQVAETLAAIGTLTAGLSHEIKNPLNAMALQLTLVRRRIRKLSTELQPALEEPLSLVEHEVKRLNGILEEFLAFARPRELVAAPVDLAETLGKVVDLLAAQAERAGVTLEHHWEIPLALVGDSGRLQQALMNLVLNAIQSTPTGGTVSVTAGRQGDDVVACIDDTGRGIPTELQQRIFDPFFTTRAEGTGLGLPLVHQTLQQHHGSIKVETSPLGGARFVVSLPAAP